MSLVMRSPRGLPMYFNASCIRDCRKTFRYGDCSSCTARACFRVPSKTGSPVVFTNSVRRMESFSVSALVRRVKSNAVATARIRTAEPAMYNQRFDFAVMVTELPEGCALTPVETVLVGGGIYEFGEEDGVLFGK